MTRQDKTGCCCKLFCCKKSSGKVGAEDQDDMTTPFVPKDDPSLASFDTGPKDRLRWFGRRTVPRPDASGPEEKTRADRAAGKARTPSVRWMDLHAGDGGGDSESGSEEDGPDASPESPSAPRKSFPVYKPPPAPSSDEDSLIPDRGELVPTPSERRISRMSSTHVISWGDLAEVDPDDDADDEMLEAFARRYDAARGR